MLGCHTVKKTTIVRVIQALAEANIRCEARHEERLQRFLVHGAWYTKLCASLQHQQEGTVDVDCGPLLILKGNKSTWERERKSSAIQFTSDVQGLLHLRVVQIAQESGASALGKMLMDYLLHAARWTEETSPPLGLAWMASEVDTVQGGGTADHQNLNQLGFPYSTPHAGSDAVFKLPTIANDAGQSTAAPGATRHGLEKTAHVTFASSSGLSASSPGVSTSGPRETSTEHGGGRTTMGPPPPRQGAAPGYDRRNGKMTEAAHHGKTLTFYYLCEPNH